MTKVLYSCLLLCSFSANAEPFIYDGWARGRANAVTAIANNGSALFYNPAMLSSVPSPSLRLVGVEVAADGQTLDLLRKKETRDSFRGSAPTDVVLARLGMGRPVTFDSAFRFIDFAIPYVGLQAFSSQSLIAVESSKDGQEALDAKFVTRTGAALGFAFRTHGIRVGYSVTLYAEASTRTLSTRTRLSELEEAVDKNSSEDVLLFLKDDLSYSYGTALRHCLGVAWNPFENNGKEVGDFNFAAAIRDLGGTRYRSSVPSVFKNLQKHEKVLQDKISSLGVTTDLPSARASEAAAGVGYNYGGSSSQLFLARLALDASVPLDAQHKVTESAAWELGLAVPEAMANAIYLDLTKLCNGRPCHVGLLGFSGFGGVSSDNYYTLGARLVLHGGAYRISFLKLTAEAYYESPIAKHTLTRERNYGAVANIALTFIL